MLVLSSAFYNNVLRTFVPEERFQELLTRTIGFLRKLINISPTCKHDCVILESISKLMFNVPDDEKHVYANEGVEPMSAATSFDHGT
jgi:hypothetical protein